MMKQSAIEITFCLEANLYGIARRIAQKLSLITPCNGKRGLRIEFRSREQKQTCQVIVLKKCSFWCGCAAGIWEEGLQVQ